MIQIDMEMPKNCMCCPFPSVGTDYYYCYCPGVEGRVYDFKQAEGIPDDCPLHEVTADPDTVSRQAVISAINALHDKPNAWLDHAVEAVKELTPSPSRPHGQWLFSPDDAEGTCTICQYKIYGWKYQGHYLIVPYNFCPNCGADMR